MDSATIKYQELERRVIGCCVRVKLINELLKVAVCSLQDRFGELSKLLLHPDSFDLVSRLQRVL